MNPISKFTYIILLLFGLNNAQSQNVGINNSNPNPVAVLDVFATDKGMSLPNVSLDSITGIITPVNAPADGLLVWNTNPNALNSFGIGPYFYSSSKNKWEYLIVKNGLDGCYDKGGDGMGYFIEADALPVNFTEGSSINDSFMVTGKLTKGYKITTLSTLPNNGDGTICYFTPSKAVFRAGKVTGNQWDNINNGRHTFSSGLDNTSKGNRSFTTNYNNTATRLSSTAFGYNNTVNNDIGLAFGFNNMVSGKNAISIGELNTINAYQNLASGTGNTTRVVNETIFGTYSKNYPIVNSTGGPEPGDPSPGIDSQWTRYVGDRTFAVGIGTNSGAKANAIEVIKDGNIIFNEAYKFNLNDGTADQTFTTDGAGQIDWTNRNPSTERVSSIALTGGDYQFVIPLGATAPTMVPLPGATVAFKFSDYDFDGDGIVEIKVLVNYTNRTPGLNGSLSQLAMDEISNTGAGFLFGNSAFTYTSAPDGIAYNTNWFSIDSTKVATIDALQLRCRNLNGGSAGTADDSTMTIQDAQILVRDK
ncbi:hypothetical protein GFJ94_00020 [Flavobacterium sp. LMO8]|uniref:hypothetical protein n=1 Tax=Flavobacterium sp. LMO8 TaxID=2654244 RepID=UPI001290C46E|nr:hypothetical protein [Flavobacterium sp. LMO8]MQP23450.1 hypothetical protein [Flavobacterium sp. LMO8]